MKIAIIGTRGLPARYSGVEKNIEETVCRLSRRGHEFIVYGHSGNALLSENLQSKYPNTHLVKVPTLSNKYLATITASFLATIDVLFKKTDIVHYHCLGPAIFSIVPRLFRKKVIVTIHDLSWQRSKWPLFAKVFLWLCQYPALYFPHQTIVISGVLKERFKHKVKFISEGVNRLEAPEENFLPQLGLERRNFILHVGRITPEKGIHYLIKAFNEIKTKMKLVITGDATYADSYLLALKKIANERTVFTGFIDNASLSALYRDAAMVIFPSEIEGLGLALLEAVSLEKCIVASDIPVFKEILGKDGIYFKNGDYLDLKRQLEYLIPLPDLRAELGRKIGDAAKRYNWDEAVISLERVYSDLLR